jgi:hypothetical protein
LRKQSCKLALVFDHQKIERLFIAVLRALHQLLIDFPVTHAA